MGMVETSRKPSFQEALAVPRSASGRTHVTTDVALFFSKLAIVTFGGAYSALA
jgi:hypothetical protein